MSPTIKVPRGFDSIENWRNCYMGAPPTLNTLRSMFTALICHAFSNVKNMDGYADELGCLTWSSNAADNNIDIKPGGVDDPGDTESVPGILISCGKEGITYEPFAMGLYTSFTPDTAGRTISYKSAVNVSFVCRHKDADVSAMMSDYVLFVLASATPLFYNTFSWILNYIPTQQTEPTLTQKSQTEGASQWYESTVIVRLDYEYAIASYEESKRIKAIELTVSDDK